MLPCAVELPLKKQDTSESDNALRRLTCSEREILQMVVEGKFNAEVAGIIFLSPKTVETYRGRRMRKLGVTDNTGPRKIRHKARADAAGVGTVSLLHPVIPASFFPCTKARQRNR